MRLWWPLHDEKGPINLWIIVVLSMEANYLKLLSWLFGCIIVPLEYRVGKMQVYSFSNRRKYNN